jgi:hypothetical protein
LAVSLPGDRPAMLRGLSLRHEGPAVLIVDEASDTTPKGLQSNCDGPPVP